MTLALALAFTLAAAPQPSAAFRQQVDAHLKAAFARAGAVAAVAKPHPIQRQGRTPARLPGR